MIPNLLEATSEYWQKLSELEAAYQQGEVSLEEVDAKVADLMAELVQERRTAMKFLLASANQIWRTQREMIVGLGLIGVLTYGWLVSN